MTRAERDALRALRAEVAIWTERTQIVAGDRSLIEAAEWADARWADAIAERDALRAAAEQAREALALEWLDVNPIDAEECRDARGKALAVLDEVLKKP